MRGNLRSIWRYLISMGMYEGKLWLDEDRGCESRRGWGIWEGTYFLELGVGPLLLFFFFCVGRHRTLTSWRGTCGYPMDNANDLHAHRGTIMGFGKCCLHRQP